MIVMYITFSSEYTHEGQGWNTLLSVWRLYILPLPQLLPPDTTDNVWQS